MHDSYWVNFLYMVYVKVYIFAHGEPLVPAPFIERTIFSSLYYSGTFVKKKIGHYV